MNPRAIWLLLKDAGSQWVEDKAPRLGAALAYYTVFSIGPLVLLVIAIAGQMFGPEAAQGQISGQIEEVVGPEGGRAIETMVAHSQQPSSNLVASLVGIAMLVFGAMGLFSQLQDALDTIWEVKPKAGRGLWGVLRDRLLSFSMVLGTAFLLLVSLVISAALSAAGSLLGEWGLSVPGQIVNVALSLVVITLVFAMIYRFLPDAKIAWKDVWLGAAITSVLFVAGKFLIGLYLGHASVGSTYGAAGSLAALLIWLYYSSQLFLFGAELTKAYANRYGSRIVPTKNAEPLTEQARAEQGIPRSDGASQPRPRETARR